MKITVEGVDLSLPVFRDDEQPVTLGDLVAGAIAANVVAEASPATTGLIEIVASVREAEIREQVRVQVTEALIGPPGRVPMTLADAIITEANAQIHQGDGYQGTSTPLKQVVSAEVYSLLHDEVLAIVTQARESIREQVREAVIKIVGRNMGNL